MVKVSLVMVTPTGLGTDQDNNNVQRAHQSHVRTMTPTGMIEMNAPVEIETKAEDGVPRFTVVPTGFEAIERDEDEIDFTQGAKWRDLTASPTGDETYTRVTSAKAVARSVTAVPTQHTLEDASDHSLEAAANKFWMRRFDQARDTDKNFHPFPCIVRKSCAFSLF